MMHCAECGGYTNYNVKYDVLFCEECDKWLEKHCGDKSCDYCSKRPENPSKIEGNHDWM